MATQDKLKIIIIGAGLGGLSASIACRMAGHDVTLLERAPALAEIGAGVQLSPNSTSILQAYQLGTELESCWVEPLRYTVQRHSDGKILHETANWDKRMRECYGAPFIDIHRGQLQLVLYRRALEVGAMVVLGASVKSVDCETGEIVLESGETYRGDLVVGADGLWSVCRAALLKEASLPQPTGDLAYRIVLNLEDVSDPDLRRLIQEPACRLWIGPNSHVVSYSLKGGHQFNIVLLVPDDLPPNVSKQSGNVKEMRALFKDWDPILTRFLDQVKDVQKWKLVHLEELPTWRSDNGNFILLGDSCHPMLPYLAQGASSAIEDGAVLGRILEKVRSRTQVPLATEIWQELRKKRSEFIVKQSSEQRDEYHQPDGPGQQKRDRFFAEYAGREAVKGFPSRWVDPEIGSYIFGYKAFEEADAATARLEFS